MISILFIQMQENTQQVDKIEILNNFQRRGNQFQSINSQLQKLSELINYQTQFNKRHIIDMINQQENSNSSVEELSTYGNQRTTKSIHFNENQFLRIQDEEEIENYGEIEKDEEDENRTILMYPHSPNYKNQSRSLGNPDQSLNSVYNKTLKASTVLKDQNEEISISQKKCKNNLGVLPRIIDLPKKTENQSVERKTLMEKKIDKQQLRRLQDAHISMDPKKLTNTNRKKKTKRQSNPIHKQTKSTIVKSNGQLQKTQQKNEREKNMYSDQKSLEPSNLINSKKDWMHEKSTKKLNRVNIARLHDNLKRTSEKTKQNKSNPYNNNQNKGTKHIKGKKIDGNYKQKDKMKGCQENFHTKVAIVQKLNFDLCQTKSLMQRILQEKNIVKSYNIVTKRYIESAKKLTVKELKDLQNQIKAPSEEAIFLMKITTIIIIFFSQFVQPSKKNLISTIIHNHKFKNSEENQIHTINEENLLMILERSKELLELVYELPTRLYSKNILSQQSINVLIQMYDNISEELDLELQFFLLKKTLIYRYLHELVEYIQYLKQYDLIEKTQRKNLYQNRNGMLGYYSSRSKRQNKPRSIKKHFHARKNCDSQRKITAEDCETDRLLKGFNGFNGISGINQRKGLARYR